MARQQRDRGRKRYTWCIVLLRLCCITRDKEQGQTLHILVMSPPLALHSRLYRRGFGQRIRAILCFWGLLGGHHIFLDEGLAKISLIESLVVQTDDWCDLVGRKLGNQLAGSDAGYKIVAAACLDDNPSHWYGWNCSRFSELRSLARWYYFLPHLNV